MRKAATKPQTVYSVNGGGGPGVPGTFLITRTHLEQQEGINAGRRVSLKAVGRALRTGYRNGFIPLYFWNGHECHVQVAPRKTLLWIGCVYFRSPAAKKIRAAALKASKSRPAKKARA